MCGVTSHHPLFALMRSTGNLLLCEAKDMEARRNRFPLQVYCTGEERQLIEEQAQRAGLSLSEFLRNVGMGYPIKCRVDQQAIQNLGKVNADMARLGGLLKMLLSNEERFVGYSGEQLRKQAITLLGDIDRIKTHLYAVAQKILTI